MDIERQRRCAVVDLPSLSPALLTEAQRELASRFGAALLAEFILQKRKEGRGFQFSTYEIPSSCFRIADEGERLGVFARTQWAKVWGSTGLTRPWCELAIEQQRIFNESPEAEAIRAKLFPSSTNRATAH